MTTETQNAEGETTQVASTQQQAQTLITDGQPAGGEGNADDQQQGASQAEGDTKEAAKPDEGAPEVYAFKAPEGKTFDTAVIDAFSGVAKELNLSQGKAQLVLDKMAPVFAQRQAEQVAAVHAQWADETRADKEIGGDRLPETLSVAKQAIAATATPELVKLLDESGFGNHPEVIKHFYKVGKAISQDSIVTSGGGITASASNGRPAADVLYDKTSSSK